MRPTLMVVRRDGSMRPLRGQSIKAALKTPRFPIIIRFERGKAIPGRASMDRLRRCAEWLAACPAERLGMVGHASGRVAAVQDLLIWLGARTRQLLRLSAPQLHRLGLHSSRAARAEQGIVELWRVPQSAPS